ncbi:Hypothetical predicted protein [Olea europaea subsp. europaea]|nr:Hypothetical predicted protein [Olea europaea subsp. europaea]
MESYTHLSGLEEEVKSYQEKMKNLEEEVMELNEKLSAAHSEMTNKENLVKQHSKVAEEAVSGWEKAEAEALALKNHLESVTLLKLTAEDRASHLDDGLKECLRQIRSLKEEHEEKLHEVVLNRTKQFDKMKLQLEANIANFEQELLRSAAENAALSRSLQERSNMLIKLSEEKSQAEAEIELLKSNIESSDREINSLKYELHIASKELEIRNEEKNMSVRSAEVVNKQHLEGVKKIAKLEAECQRLRGLVRKRLPGPAALAQMKLEVETLGRDHGDSRLRRSMVKPPTSHLSHQLPEFSLDSIHRYQKENELLTERLLAMEEETKMLKEALANRNSELLASRSMCADAAHKLQDLEVQLHANGEHKSPAKSNAHVPIEGSYIQNASNPPCLTSMSECGNDDDAGSCATVLMSEHSYFKKEKNVDSPLNSGSSHHLDLMDDFLEMEKIAYLSNDSNAVVSCSDLSGNTGNVIANYDTSIEATASMDVQSKGHLESATPVFPSEVIALIPQVHVDPPTFLKLQSRISMVLELMSKGKDMEMVLEDIKCVVQDMHDTLHPKSSNCVADAAQCLDTAYDHKTGAEVSEEEDLSSSGDSKMNTEILHTINQELAVAISQIYDFVMILGKEAKVIQVTAHDGGLKEKMDVFSAKYNEIINCRTNLPDFVLDLSLVLSKARELHFNILGYENSEVETGSSDCIDKIALPENKGIVDSSAGRYSNGCTQFSDSTSDPDIPHDGNLVPTSELTATSWKCLMEELEQLKLEKDNVEIDLVRCTENLESTKLQLLETEQHLSEVMSQLTSSQKLNSLAETQLKCMAESYRSLEARAEELQTEVNLLHGKIETLDNELLEERRNYQDALARCKDLQENLQRFESYSAADNGAKTKQEELAAAAEKLEECQQTIFLLGKQLKALRPQGEATGSPLGRSQKGICFTEEPTMRGMNLQDADLNDDTSNSINLQRAGSNSSLDSYNSPFNPSDSEVNNLLRSPVSSNHPKHWPTQSVSSSLSSTPAPEKHSRGFSRFFSSKGKNGQ